MNIDRVILWIFKCAVYDTDRSAASGHLHKVCGTDARSSTAFIVSKIYIIQSDIFGKLSYDTKRMQEMKVYMLHGHTVTLPEEGCRMVSRCLSHLLSIACLERRCGIVSHFQTVAVHFFDTLYITEKLVTGSGQSTGRHIKSLYMSDTIGIAPVWCSGVRADITAPGNSRSAYGIIITFRYIQSCCVSLYFFCCHADYRRYLEIGIKILDFDILTSDRGKHHHLAMEDQAGIISFQRYILHVFQQNTDIFHFVGTAVTIVAAQCI